MDKIHGGSGKERLAGDLLRGRGMLGENGGDLVGKEVNMRVNIEVPGWKWYLLEVVVDMVQNAWELERFSGKAWPAVDWRWGMLGGERNMQGNNTVVFLVGGVHLRILLLEGGLRGCSDLKVWVRITGEDKVTPRKVNCNVVNAAGGSGTVLPSPRFIAMKALEGRWEEHRMPMKKVVEQIRMSIVVFGIEVTNKGRSARSHSGVGINEKNNGELLPEGKAIRQRGPPTRANVKRSARLRGVSHKDIE